jgi:hypothetical protein
MAAGRCPVPYPEDASNLQQTRRPVKVPGAAKYVVPTGEPLTPPGGDDSVSSRAPLLGLRLVRADSPGRRRGDECAYVFGATQGASGQLYNQVIHHHRYLTQEEFSNLDFAQTGGGCLQSE